MESHVKMAFEERVVIPVREMTPLVPGLSDISRASPKLQRPREPGLGPRWASLLVTQSSTVSRFGERRGAVSEATCVPFGRRL